MVLGKIGRNLLVAHKRSIYRCAPEQLRPATNSETVIAEGPEENELLGIKNLLEKGQFPRSQFHDLTSQPMPPIAPEEATESPQAPLTADQCLHQARQAEAPTEASAQPALVPTAASREIPESTQPDSQPYPARIEPASEPRNPEVSYGPIRRATKKSSPPEVDVLSRPDCTQADDFVEMMQEVVPRLLASMPSEGSGSGASSSSAVRPGIDGASASSHGHDTPRTEGQKRSALLVKTQRMPRQERGLEHTRMKFFSAGRSCPKSICTTAMSRL